MVRIRTGSVRVRTGSVRVKTGSVRVGTGSVRLKTEDLGSKEYPMSGSPPSYPASILQHRPAPADQRNIFQPVKDWAYYEEEDRLTDKGNMLKTTNIERQREYDRRLEWEEERWKVEREREREREREYLEEERRQVERFRDSWGPRGHLDKLMDEKFECFDNRW